MSGFTYYGQLERVFFRKSQTFLGSGRQIWPKNFGAFVTFCERQRNNYILKFSFHFHEIQFRTKTCTFFNGFKCQDSRTTDNQRDIVFENPKLFGLGQTNLTKKVLGAYGIWEFISTHFGTLSLLSMFSIISTKNWAFISTSQINIWDWGLNLDCKELGI